VKRTKFIYTGIHVSDLDRAIEFYTREMGMELLFKSATPIKETGGRVAELRSKGSSQILELNWYPKGYEHGGGSGLDHLAFEVGDLETEYGRMTKRYEGALAPFVEGKWKLAYIKDPDGNWIELGERRTQKKSEGTKKRTKRRTA
jgi:lactoylglutathione lyase